jgi:hypothetical protein
VLKLLNKTQLINYQRGNFMLRRVCLIFLLIFFSINVFAQVSAPSREQTQAAVLADMSNRTGETVTINSLTSQQWYYGTYDFVRSLGCAASPTIAPTSGNWQRFVFNYRGVDYIYLVSDNLQSLILCNEPSLPTAIPPTTPPTATQQGGGQSGGGFAPTATPVSVDFGNLPTATVTRQGGGQSGGGFAATASATCALVPRLRLGSNGRVTPGEANWLHLDPSRDSEKTGEIPAGASFDVLQGPVCDSATGMNYWQVNYSGLEGWTSEGLNGEYWLEPYAITFQPETINDAFVPEWANAIPADGNPFLVLSPQNNYIAISSGTNQVDLIQNPDNSAVATIILEAEVTSLDFQVSGDYLTIGLTNGELQLYQLYPTVELLAIFLHEAAVTGAAITYENAILAVADEAGILSFWSTSDSSAPLRRIQLPEAAGNLEFSGDSRLLLVYDQEGAFITALQIP